MIFNSIDFFVFFGVVFIIHWFFINKKSSLQNLFLLAVSLFFYSCWDYRFLALLLFSIIIDFFAGIQISKSKTILKAKIWCYTTISINLGVLMVFKYYNFFIENFNKVFNSNTNIDEFNILNIVLPIGISFYTFHGVSYLIDIKNKKILPEVNFISYALFVSYFPLLVAGPIERATHLLPQIKKKRIFNSVQISSGFRQMLWGLFKKVVIADTCAEYANEIFNNYQDYSSGFLIIGAVLFSIQIYGDFSGYTDIALGASRVLGIELIKNFNFPYFSKSIYEFWKKWHISLTSWFRDYLYIPLGGSRGSKFKAVRNTWIVFLVSGFWHGANWTFIFWGALNALIVTPRILFPFIYNFNFSKTRIFKCLSIMFTFMLITILWIFFRSDNISNAFDFLEKIVDQFNVKIIVIDLLDFIVFKIGYLKFSLIITFFIIEWFSEKNSRNYGLEVLPNQMGILRWGVYLILALLILLNMGKEIDFIYFQF